MIASKPYVFPPRIMLTSLEIVRILIIIVSLFLKTDVVICTVLFLVEQPDEIVDSGNCLRLVNSIPKKFNV